MTFDTTSAAGVKRLPWQLPSSGAGRDRLRTLLAPLILGWLVVLAPALASAQEDDAASSPFAFEVDVINEGLPPDETPVSLDTPRVAMETFLDAIESEAFLEAARVLNMEVILVDEQADQASDLALKLAFLLRRHDLINWAELPDQPDARVLPTAQGPSAPYSRRTIELGEVEAEGRPTPISLQRFQVGEDEPVWLFSPSTVGAIEEMYRASRSGLTGQWIPLRERLQSLGHPSLAEWIVAGVLLLCIAVIWLAVFYGARLLTWRLPIRWSRSGKKVALPLATFVAALALQYSLSNLVLLTGPIASRLEVASEFIMLAAAAWLLIQGVSVVTRALSQRYVVPLAQDDPENRRTKTTLYVVRRMAMVVVAVLCIGYILLRVGLFEDFGRSVLASAGVIGVLAAIAARPLLGNLVAGLQIAFTDPIRVGDIVVYDGYWARVEDVSFAHTILLTWTNTRLVVPHSEFLSKAFENWSKEDEAVRRIVKLPVDYSIDVDLIRRKVAELIKGDARWSGEEALVEMVEIDSETALLWVWISGKDADSSWYLHNEMREKLVAYLKDLDDGAYLPRRRHMLVHEQGEEPPPPRVEPGQKR